MSFCDECHSYYDGPGVWHGNSRICAACEQRLKEQYGYMDLHVEGETYGVREVLKKFYLQWDPALRCWHGELNRNALNVMVEELTKQRLPIGIKIVIPQNEQGQEEGINL